MVERKVHAQGWEQETLSAWPDQAAGEIETGLYTIEEKEHRSGVLGQGIGRKLRCAATQRVTGNSNIARKSKSYSSSHHITNSHSQQAGSASCLLSLQNMYSHTYTFVVSSSTWYHTHPSPILIYCTNSSSFPRNMWSVPCHHAMLVLMFMLTSETSERLRTVP